MTDSWKEVSWNKWQMSIVLARIMFRRRRRAHTTGSCFIDKPRGPFLLWIFPMWLGLAPRQRESVKSPRKQKCVQLCWTSATNEITRESCYLAWCPPLRTPLQCPFVYLKRTFHGHSLWTEHLLCISTYAAHLITILISLFWTPLPPHPCLLKSPVLLLRYSLFTNDYLILGWKDWRRLIFPHLQ